MNAAKDASDLVAKLRAYHNSSQTKKVLSQHRDSVQSENSEIFHFSDNILSFILFKSFRHEMLNH